MAGHNLADFDFKFRGRLTPLFAGILPAVAAGLLGACAHGPEATQANPAGPGDAATQPSRNSEYECVDSALRTSYALVAFQRGRASDAEVQASLVGSISLQQLREQRLHEAQIWTRSHDPAQVSANHLTWCLAQNKSGLAEDDVLVDCLRSTEPAAFLSIARRVGDPQIRAVQAMHAFYAAKAPSDSESLADAIYGAPTDNDDLKIRALLFSTCIAHPARAFGPNQTR